METELPAKPTYAELASSNQFMAAQLRSLAPLLYSMQGGGPCPVCGATGGCHQPCGRGVNLEELLPWAGGENG